MQIDSKKCLRKRDVALKKRKEEENKKWKRCSEKRINEDKICLTSKRKKYNLGHNCKSSQSQKSQDKINTIPDKYSKKCLHKRDISRRKKIFLKTRRGVLKREKINICLEA